MKVLTAEEEQAHDRAVWKGGALGSISGFGVGAAGVWAATQRFHAFRSLSVPFRVFLVTATTSFGGVIAADRYSRAFEKSRHEDSDYVNKSEDFAAQAAAQKSMTEKIKAFVSEQRYPIVFGSWVASMAIALGLVSRHPTLTGQQKLVQARVYAQGLTLAVLVASFGLEGNDMRAGKGRWETVRVVDPDDPEQKRMIDKEIHHEEYAGQDQWMDMLDAQEARMKNRGHAVREGKGANKKEAQQDEQQQKRQQKPGDQKQKDGSKQQKGQQQDGELKTGQAQGYGKAPQGGTTQKKGNAQDSNKATSS